MRNSRFRIVSICILLVASTVLMGLGFNNPIIVMDTTKNIVYQNINADKILVDFISDSKTAEADYKDNYYSIRGTISEKKKNNKQFSIVGVSGQSEDAIRCVTNDKELIDFISSLEIGEIVDIYGKLTVDIFDKDLEVSIDSVKISEDVRPITSYSLKDGTSIDSKSMYSRSLNEDRINYLIPAAWQTVEHSIKDEKLGEIEGYQYCLNEISSSPAVDPESLFIFYFDNKLLKNPNDKTQTDSIERAIIANILDKKPDKLEKFPLTKVTTYYGDKYQYYQDAYRKPLGDGYHTEFIFQADNEDGIIVFLYVYKEKTPHLSDVLFTMRLFNK